MWRSVAPLLAGGRIYRTYFVNGRGDEVNANTWSYLDLTALGRQEEWEDSPQGYPQTPPYVWWKWHDAYDAEPSQEHLEQTARALEAYGGGCLCRPAPARSPVCPPGSPSPHLVP